MPTTKLKSKPLARPAARARGGVIDSRRRELAEQENQLQAEINALQRTIEEAPVRAQVEAKRQREAFIESSRVYHLHSVLPEAGHSMHGMPVARRSRRQPTLRKERIAARRQTLALVVALAFALLWLAGRFMH
jgi:predicted RNase H-like nuclease (RuvC/YqgF family)